MKKLISVLCCCIFAIFLISCACSDRILGNSMIEYYSDDSNYVQVEGTIMSVYQFPNTQECMYYIKINTEGHNFQMRNDGTVPFEIYSDLEVDLELQEGDEIVFISAPMFFYNGHHLPIVSLEKDNISYLSFEKGKADYLDWITSAFLD